MDILIIDPPHIILKNVPTDRGYNVGPASLAAYLRAHGVEAALVTGDLLTDYKPQSVLASFVREWNTTVRDLARGQRLIAAAADNPDHPVWRRLAGIVRAEKPRAVGISFLTPLKPVVDRVATVVKEVNPDIVVIAGSFHPTLCPEDVLQNRNIDFCVLGEGEIPLLALVSEMKKTTPRWQDVPGLAYRGDGGAVRRTALPAPIDDLDALPFLGRDMVLNCDYSVYRVHSMITARGCPYDCAFCSDKRLWRGSVRRRSVPRVMGELLQLQERYHPETVDFVDGTFTYDRKYVEQFCQALIGSGLNIKWRCTARYDNLDAPLLNLMQRAGCTALFLGLESGSNRILNAISKKESVEDIVRVSRLIRDAGIMAITSVLIGLPDETKEDIEDTLALMRRFKTEVFDVNVYVPVPGSKLYDNLSAEELARIDWRKCAYKSLDNKFTRHLSAQEFARYQSEAYRIADGVRRNSIFRIVLKKISHSLGNIVTTPFRSKSSHVSDRKPRASSPFSYS